MILPEQLKNDSDLPRDAGTLPESVSQVLIRKIGTLRKSTVYEVWLCQQQNLKDPFPNSVPDVPSERTFEEYLSSLAQYQSMICSDKTDFFQGHASIGHKVHLNVAPENAQIVSIYLKMNKYAHKYLSGGDTEDGKIFTIYFGSMEKTKEWVQLLSRDLQKFLLRPFSSGEIEYAPNISGRFVGNKNEFTQYPAAGTRGFSALIELVRGDLWTKRPPEAAARHVQMVFKGSYQRLADLYGAYFYGK